MHVTQKIAPCSMIFVRMVVLKYSCQIAIFSNLLVNNNQLNYEPMNPLDFDYNSDP